MVTPTLFHRRLRRPGARGVAALLGATLLAAAAAAEPAAEELPEPTLEAFMEGMAATSGVVARFHETKELALLSEPLEVRGILYFVPPDRLARITREPGASRLVIDGDRFLFRDAAGGETLDLSENPVAREFVSNFIVLFNGDLEALRARYEPDFRVEGRRWRLVLRPRHRPLSEFMERVTLTGQGRVLERMELLERDGDRTTTRFEDVEVDRRFSEAELERIFATDGTLPDALPDDFPQAPPGAPAPDAP